MTRGADAQSKRVLLTWVGSRDPGWDNPRTGTLQPGPVLSLLEEKHFDLVYLFFNLEGNADDFRQKANQVYRYSQRHFPQTDIRHRPVELTSVIDYKELYRVMNRECQQIQADHCAENEELYVYLSPGTPQMQTVWVLLVQSGLLSATMLDTTPREFLAPGMPIWRRVDLSISDFPQVLSPGAAAELAGVLEAQVANLRLENEHLRAELEVCHSSGAASHTPGLDQGIALSDILREQEAAYFRLAILKAGGNAAQAARLLGIEPAAFRARAVTLGIRNRRSRRHDQS